MASDLVYGLDEFPAFRTQLMPFRESACTILSCIESVAFLGDFDDSSWPCGLIYSHVDAVKPAKFCRTHPRFAAEDGGEFGRAGEAAVEGDLGDFEGTAG